MITFFKDEQQDILEANILIRQQIKALDAALFFTENNTGLALPVHVINNVTVNEAHEIWFLIHRPTQALSEFDTQLPAKLDFFKKGMPYQVKVKGIAVIVDNAAKVSELNGGTPAANMIAVKVSMTGTEYIETVAKPAQNWLQQSKQTLSSLFA